MNKFRLAILLVAGLLAACAESQRPNPTGTGTFRGINAAVTAPRIDFKIEERGLGRLRFRDSSSNQEFDNLSYIINFDYTFTGEVEATRLVSIPFDLIEDTDYTFVYTGSLSEPGSLVWERPVRFWEGTETIFELTLAHLSPELGEVDIYLLPAGELPVLGEADASLDYTEKSAQLEFESVEYELFVTGRDDPTDILFQSEIFAFASAQNFMVALFGEDPSITAPFSVRLIAEDSGQSLEISEVNSPPTMRTFHTSFGTVPFDLYLNNDFSAPLHANIAYGEISSEEDSIADTSVNTFTEAGNVGVVLLESELVTVSGVRNTRFLIGDPTALDTILTVDNLRPAEDATRIRIVHTSFNAQLLDFYLIRRDEELNEMQFPFLNNFLYPGISDYTNILAESYDIYVTRSTSQEIVAGPIPLDLSPGDVSHLLILDTADPNVVDVIEYDRVSLPQPAPN